MHSFENNFLTEAKLKAEDYEAAIVMGFYTITKRVMESTENYGIKQSLYDKIENTPSAKKAGELIATKILKDYPQLKNKKAEVFGRAKSSLTDFWKSYGASDCLLYTSPSPRDQRGSGIPGSA